MHSTYTRIYRTGHAHVNVRVHICVCITMVCMIPVVCLCVLQGQSWTVEVSDSQAVVSSKNVDATGGFCFMLKAGMYSIKVRFVMFGNL